MKWKLATITLALMTTLDSCTVTPTKPGSPALPPSSASGTTTPGSITCPSGTWCSQYQVFLLAQLTTTGLAKHSTSAADLSGLCSQSQDSAAFWPALVKAIAYAESSYKPALGYTEKFNDASTGTAALSVGLLQLSVGDKLNYKTPYCQLLTPSSLKDPAVNLGCGVEIMSKLLSTPGTVQARLGLYWSTVRPGHPAVARLKVELPSCK